MVRLKQVVFWDKRAWMRACGAHVCFTTLFQTTILTEFWASFLLTTSARTTSVCLHGWRASLAGLALQSPPPFPWADRHHCSKSHPSSSAMAARTRLLPAAWPWASRIRAVPVFHGFWPNRPQATGGWTGPFVRLDPFSRVYFGCLKYSVKAFWLCLEKKRLWWTHSF